jgi:hypothetical protein
MRPSLPAGPTIPAPRKGAAVVGCVGYGLRPPPPQPTTILILFAAEFSS